MAGNRSDVHKRALCLYEKRRKCLSDGQWTPDIGFENHLCSVDVLVQERHEMIPPGVVDQVGQSAPCMRRDGILNRLDMACIGYFELQQSDIGEVFQSTCFVQVAGCGEDVVATFLEDEGQAGANATVTAACDEN